MATYNAVNACCYREWRYIPHITQDIRQGEWEDGECVGVMVFDLNAIRNMYATNYPTSASLTLTRTNSGYNGRAINLYLYAGNQTGIPTVNNNVSTDAPRPTKVTSAYTYNISGGQGVKTVGISTALIDSIGKGNSNCLFMDAGQSTDRYMGFTGRGNLTKIVLTINWATRTTAVSAPTSVSVNQTVANDNVTLSWSGASNGINNNISAYEIQYSDSSNNADWGAWSALSVVNSTATSGSLSVAPPSSRGSFRRFRVCTRGSAGSAYYSGWRVSSNSVRKNTYPNMPTSVVASPEVYSDEPVILTWSGASGTTSPIKGYQIASRTSTGVPTTPDLNITQLFIPVGASNRPGRVNNMQYVTIHETDNTDAGSNARGHAEWLQTPDTAVSWHYTVDDTETYQQLPENEDGFHAGDGAGDGNRHSIGIEICVNSDGDFLKAVNRAAVLTADICTRHNIPLSNVVQHNHWSGKDCPDNIRAGIPYSWDVFIQHVAAAMESEITWSAWVVLAVIDLAATGGSYSPTVSRTPGTYTEFGVWTIDALGSYSGERVSNSIFNIQKDVPPLAPLVSAPNNNSVTYNTRSMILIQTQPEPDGQPQRVYVRMNDGDWQNSVDDPEHFTTSGEYNGEVNTVYTADELTPGTHTVIVRTWDGGFYSPTVSRTFTVMSPPFESITSQQSVVKARHITDLRTAVNDLRNYYGMVAYTWETDIIPGTTLVAYWPFHILELRAALEAVIDLVNDFDTANAEPLVEWLNIGTGRPRANVMNQIKDLILKL